MEIFSTSEKLNNINFLFQRQEMLSEFTNFLDNEAFSEKNTDFKIKQDIFNILNDVFELKLKKNSIEFGFFNEYIDQIENKKKMQEIFNELKKLIDIMRPKDLNLMKENILKLFKN